MKQSTIAPHKSHEHGMSKRNAVLKSCSATSALPDDACMPQHATMPPPPVMDVMPSTTHRGTAGGHQGGYRGSRSGAAWLKLQEPAAEQLAHELHVTSSLRRDVIFSEAFRPLRVEKCLGEARTLDLTCLAGGHASCFNIQLNPVSPVFLSGGGVVEAGERGSKTSRPGIEMKFHC